MSNLSIPAWYFPTTVVFLDDNLEFLTYLESSLDTKRVVPKLFTDPNAAEAFLKEHAQTQNILQKMTDDIVPTSFSRQVLDIDVTKIHHEINNSKRFDQVSLLVVDYAMPAINGLDFCKKIAANKYSFKILMLTGEADDKLAIKAFNDGTIHHFVRKDEASYEDHINNAIYDLQMSFFKDSSEIISSGRYDSITNLRDPVFVQLFSDICQKHNIVEYYLLDTDGSLLLVDYSGRPMILTVKNEQGMHDAYQVALEADEPFPTGLLKDMENRKKILCLYEQEICDDAEEAKRFLHPAEKIIGQDTYYYALVTNLDPYHFDRKNLIGFKEYEDNLANF